MKSWKTTVSALAAGVGSAVLGAYQLKPELLTGFPTWLPGAALLMTSVGGACVGIFARDNDKTSEQVGAGRDGAGAMKPIMMVLAGLLALGGLTACNTTRLQYDHYSVSPAGVTNKEKLLIKDGNGWQASKSIDKLIAVKGTNGVLRLGANGLSESSDIASAITAAGQQTQGVLATYEGRTPGATTDPAVLSLLQQILALLKSQTNAPAK